MRIVFFGTPAFAVPYAQALRNAGHHIAAVVTQPDRPRGRGMQLQPSPVKQWAMEHGVPVHQATNLRDEEFLHSLRELAPDVIVVVAYGRVVPPEVLRLPPHGCVNVHPSLLPAHRGASPIQAALLAGDEVTGVTIMYMDEGLDTGDIILQQQVEVDPADDAGTLGERLNEMGRALLLEALRQIEEGTAPRVPQDDAQATYAPPLEKAEGFIRWGDDGIHIHRRIRAFTPAPGAFTRLRGRRVRIWRAELGAQGENSAIESPSPGTIVAVEAEGITVQTGNGMLRLTEVQPENGRRMTAAAFANGYRIQPGDRFESPDDQAPPSEPSEGGETPHRSPASP